MCAWKGQLSRPDGAAARLGGRDVNGQKPDPHAFSPADNQKRRGMKLIG